MPATYIKNQIPKTVTALKETLKQMTVRRMHIIQHYECCGR